MKMNKPNQTTLVNLSISFPYILYIECIGTGRDALGVIEATISQKKSLEKRAKKEVDFTWAVFDKDSADENKAKIKDLPMPFYLQKEIQ
ncbi:MAG: hypothetical protein R2824_10525 [Saprospiraceae bacterium]